jgi:hypothetical protein
MTAENKANIIERLSRLRSLVGYLGEKGQFGWWDTGFLNRTGLQFLEINFPRTAFAAGCKGVMEAAKRLHDERIGKGEVYHLFRLPTGFEEDLHHALLEADPGDLLPQLESREKAMEALRSMVADTVGAPEGPVQIGTMRGALRPADIQEIAVHYYDAFRNRKMCFPYFVADR